MEYTKMNTENVTLTSQEYMNLMAHKITHDVVKEVDDKIDKLEVKLESKIDALDVKLSGRIDKLDGRIDKLESKLDSNFKWVMGVLVITILVPIALQFVK
jgi:uncharacterized protein YaaR (DUF327 family)